MVAEVGRHLLGCTDDLLPHDSGDGHLDHADMALIPDSSLGEAAQSVRQMAFLNSKHRAEGSLRYYSKGENRASDRACLDHKLVGWWKKT